MKASRLRLRTSASAVALTIGSLVLVGGMQAANAASRCVTDVAVGVAGFDGVPAIVSGAGGAHAHDFSGDTDVDGRHEHGVVGATLFGTPVAGLALENVPIIGPDSAHSHHFDGTTDPVGDHTHNITGVVTSVTPGYGEGPGGALNPSSATGTDAFACGPDAEATGNAATAVGNNATATGDSASALGANSVANGENATAVGQGANADGTAATAIGRSAQAVGAEATATGAFSNADGANATANGARANAVGANATALGSESDAIGANATAGGAFANATGTNATAYGHSSLAIGGNNVTAIGQDSTANGENTTAVGQAASAVGTNASAFGRGFNASANNATAVGAGAQANHNGSVAIGRDSAGNVATSSLNNEFVLGTANHTYTAPGITSAESRNRQSGPLEVATTDSNGHLATDGGQIFRELGEQGAGIAIAMALENPDLVGNETFGLAANLGFFEGNTALGVALMGVLGHNFVGGNERWAVSGGVGVSLNENEFGGQGVDRTVAGRAGVQVSW